MGADEFGIAIDDDHDASFVGFGECDDNNPLIHPGALEIPYNGIDENCNGMTDDDDVDQDGYLLANDCNDNDQSIYPGAWDMKHDGIDQDCNGYDLTIDITTAEYTTKKDRLVVDATTELGSAAMLVLDGFGPMAWTGNKWTLTIQPAGGNPSTVTVSGVEGTFTRWITVN
jgi:hypothetical protein